MIKHSLKAALSVLLILAFTASLLMSGCGAKKAESLPYTITLQSEGGRPLSDVVISVYGDEGLSKLVWASTTDKDGKITFTAPEGDYYAALKEAPKGYSIEKSYVINSDNMTISLTDMAQDSVCESIRKTDINTLTPIEAMNLIFQWKKDLE